MQFVCSYWVALEAHHIAVDGRYFPATRIGVLP